MSLELVVVPCLKDNYAYLLHDAVSGSVAVIDVPDARAVIEALDRRGWTPSDILLTHHHADHVQGVAEVLRHAPAAVWGAAADAHRLPAFDHPLSDGDTFHFGGEEVRVFDASGHTVGHIAFYIPRSGYLFTGDSLMAAGCGRLFEGTAAQMWATLSTFAGLPDEVQVCSGHNYTAANLAFALSLEPGREALISRSRLVADADARGKPTVPSALGVERATNPFLRASDPDMKAAMGMKDASDAAVFAAIRAAKDKF